MRLLRNSQLICTKNSNVSQGDEVGLCRISELDISELAMSSWTFSFFGLDKFFSPHILLLGCIGSCHVTIRLGRCPMLHWNPIHPHISHSTLSLWLTWLSYSIHAHTNKLTQAGKVYTGTNHYRLTPVTTQVLYHLLFRGWSRRGLLVFFLGIRWRQITLRETNLAPENRPSQKETHLPNPAAMLVSGRVHFFGHIDEIQECLEVKLLNEVRVIYIYIQ